MICPSCGYKRKKNDTVPEWQCPSCQVAYNKVMSDRALSQPKKKRSKSIGYYIKNSFSWYFSKSRKLFLALWRMMKHIHAYFYLHHQRDKMLTLQEKSILLCQQCGSEMFKTTHSSGNFVGIMGALIVFFLGILLILMSLGMGGKRQKIWKCEKCGYFFPRL